MKKNECRYWPYYCEENIWHLCQNPKFERQSVNVLFISNTGKHCFFSHQQAGKYGQVIWDYHVVLMVDNQIWDLDTLLPFPCQLTEYLEKTFSFEIETQFMPKFRAISREYYIKNLTSDRSHMKDSDGNYLQPPPPWPCISPEMGSNIFKFTNMENPSPGTVYTLDQLITDFHTSKKRSPI